LLKLLGLEESKSAFAINLTKIFVIMALSILFIGFFLPYFEGADDYLYGVQGIRLSNGLWEYNNELLQKTGSWEFVPQAWVKTVHGTAVPLTSVGMPIIAMVAYSIGGQYGLFYLGPIIGITFFIVTERVTTKLFGRFAALLTLLFLAFNLNIIYSSITLLNNIVFTLFFVLGCFYLINFLKNEKAGYALLCSTFFVISTFIRINGIVFFPLEFLVIGAYFTINNLEKLKSNHSHGQKSILFYTRSFFSRIKIKTFKVSILLAIPWIIFFLFWFSYNDYYFGDPLTDYRSARILGISGETDNYLTFNENQIGSFMGFFKSVLPFPFAATNLPDAHDTILGKYWLGILTPVILASVLIITFRSKDKRIEAVVFTFFILGALSFFAFASNADDILERGVAKRYVIPAFTIFAMLIGFLISQIFSGKLLKISSSLSRRSIKLPLVIFIVIVMMAFYLSSDILGEKVEKLKFKNPQELAARFPLDVEGLNSSSVLITGRGADSIEYGVIPFSKVYGLTLKESVPLLKQIVTEGYDVYTLKNGSRIADKETFRELVEHHDMILKDYSKSFCKLSLVEDSNDKSTDKICI